MQKFNIDGGRENLPKFFVEQGMKVGAEIGVYKGEFTEKFCQVGLKMYAIDPWKAFRGQGRTQQKQERQDFIYGHAQRLLSPYDCTLIRKTSMEALEDFADESLDFVYIDGDHSFLSVTEDIFHWAKKVRKGGFVSGHDYDLTSPHSTNTVIHVKPVVDAYCQVLGIQDLCVFGKTDASKNDRYPSWLFQNTSKSSSGF